MRPEDQVRPTTVLAVAKDGILAMSAAGQVTVGDTVTQLGAE